MADKKSGMTELPASPVAPGQSVPMRVEETAPRTAPQSGGETPTRKKNLGDYTIEYQRALLANKTLAQILKERYPAHLQEIGWSNKDVFEEIYGPGAFDDPSQSPMFGRSQPTQMIELYKHGADSGMNADDCVKHATSVLDSGEAQSLSGEKRVELGRALRGPRTRGG